MERQRHRMTEIFTGGAPAPGIPSEVPHDG